ncbi:capsular polysaccharide synthesis protein [Companilactobacillus insicii]|uniref:capsular polysaccharide synthesis protein n=1 Tax=Companilactobacillus insicii TaxID=1732567 RepID=UPI0013DDE091|nr:capsular polysaccharide synthesis protein [Companilactobacillus insicii]
MSQSFLNLYLTGIYKSESALKKITGGKKSILPSFVYDPYHYLVEKKIQQTIQDVPTTFWHDELIKTDHVLTNKIVWVMWWQVSDIPPLVQRNLMWMRERLNKRVIVLNQENIEDFVDIPEDVLDQVNHQKMSYQLFSDYIRMKILFEYGGVWLDSTIYIGGPDNFLNQLNFEDHSLITIKGIKSFGSKFVPKGRWVIYCIGGRAGQMLFKFIDDCLTYYIENDIPTPDYFLTDYLFDIAYRNDIGGFREKLERVPSNNINCEELAPLMNSKFDERVLDKMTRNTSVFKLSNKVSYRSRTVDQDRTFYSYLYE